MDDTTSDEHGHEHHDHDLEPGPAGAVDWKLHGVKVIPGDQLDPTRRRRRA